MLLALTLMPMMASAAVQEIRVTASATDSSPTRATQAALNYARKRAVYLVMLKMHIPNATARAQGLNETQLKQIIRGSTILNTKRIEDTTYADVSVSVVDQAILHVLDIDVAPDAVALETTAPVKGVMVLPVYATATRAYVWEKENALRAPLTSLALTISHGTVVVPTGDYEDLRLIDQHNALTIKPEELKSMFERYGVREIIIAVVQQDTLTSDQGATILLRRLSQETIRTEQIVLSPPALTETADDRLKEAATEIANAATQIAASTSKQEQEKLAAAPKVPVYFYYGSMREIGQIQDAVRGTDGVMQLSMPTIALNNIHGILYLNTDKETVKRNLSLKGLIITDREDGWQLSLR